eukprot:2214891-Lingulodinium_polyedra.AAC.1
MRSETILACFASLIPVVECEADLLAVGRPAGKVISARAGLVAVAGPALLALALATALLVAVVRAVALLWDGPRGPGCKGGARADHTEHRRRHEVPLPHFGVPAS